MVNNTMNDERIKVQVTESGQMMDVVVLHKRVDKIQIVIGSGVHSVTCDLLPTRNGMAYAGSVRGREIIYEHSREQIKMEVEQADQASQKSRNTRARRTIT